jgi:hypothetical protein
VSTLPGTPLVWSPKGASDTLDSSTSFPGAMSSLSNLIPDPTTKNLWQCRPAAVKLVDLSASVGGDFGPDFGPDFGHPNASFISCWLNVGTRIYGMVATTRNPSRDEPFCYDVPTQSFIPITGATAANSPISPPTFGNWNPPTMVLVGSKIVVVHPGFTGAAGSFFGIIDVLNPFALTWTATNTSPTPLIFPPQWVSNFNGRAYFLVNPPNAQPAAYFSDEELPTQITNANQVITFDDNTPLTCSAGLALSNQLGGIIQALMVFKGVSNIYQITGDAALGTLAKNSLNVATGTFAPNSITSTEKGLLFMAPDGIRLIDFNAKVSDPIGKDGEGVTVPFIFALVPSRASAMYNTGIYRVQMQNGEATPQQQEWWYDTVRQLWSGPHTTGVSLGIPYQDTFLVTLQGAGAIIFQSDAFQSFTSTFVENGNQLSYVWQTSPLPDTDQMSELCIIQSTLHMALVSGQSTTITAFNQDVVPLDQVTIASVGTPTNWNQFNWNNKNWNGSTANNALFPRRMDWHAPLVFRRMYLQATGNSAQGLKIGRLHMRYELLGYLQDDTTFTPSLPSGQFVLDSSVLGGPDVLQ